MSGAAATKANLLLLSKKIDTLKHDATALSGGKKALGSLLPRMVSHGYKAGDIAET